MIRLPILIGSVCVLAACSTTQSPADIVSRAEVENPHWIAMGTNRYYRDLTEVSDDPRPGFLHLQKLKHGHWFTYHLRCKDDSRRTEVLEWKDNAPRARHTKCDGSVDLASSTFRHNFIEVRAGLPWVANPPIPLKRIHTK